MVPLSSLLHMTQSHGPDRAMRYNGFRTADLNGAAAPGYSTGQAQAAIERIAEGDFAARLRLRMDRADLPGKDRRATRSSSSCRFPCCSFSSSWPRNTKASSCRWPCC
jgi:hypothetical protein